LVDGSDPTYKSTHRETPKIPPTAVGGWFRSNLQKHPSRNSQNPTNGSWWIRSDPTYKKAPIENP
jgi:hypothetical protein